MNRRTATPLQMRSSLTVSSYSRRLLRGKWRILKYKCAVLSKRGVMHQPCVISAVLDEGLQQLIMHSAGTLQRNRAVYGKTRQLVSKANRLALHLKQSRAAASLSSVGREPRTNSTSHASVLAGDIETSSVSSRAAGSQRSSRATTASRTVSGTCSLGLKHFAHEEGVAAGDLIYARAAIALSSVADLAKMRTG